MQILKFIIIFKILLFLTDCKGQDKNNNVENIKLNSNEKTKMEEVLTAQLKTGHSGLYNESFDVNLYKYSENDLEAIIPILKNQLQFSGFKFLDSETFNKKIESIFGRIIDNKLSSKYLYIAPENKCDRDVVFYTNDHTIDTNPYSYYIIKNDNFLTELHAIPELIDYKKEYPEIAKIEDSINTVFIDKDGEKINLYLWKDFEDYDVPKYNLKKQRYFNQQLLINRNKYLFNDNKASFAWLKFNDSLFLESLVTTFGYTKDKDLLDWVMRKNHSKAQEFVNNYVFLRNCKGELEIREDILKYIEETTNDKEHVYYDALYYYETYENPNKWSEKEVYKILAYKANTYDYLFMKHRSLGLQSSGRWNILGGVFYYSDEGEGERWKKIEENFKNNNYYNLPHLKYALEYAYGFEAVGAPD